MTKKICFYTQPFSWIKSYRDMVDVAVKYNISAIEGFSQFEFGEPDVKEALAVKKYADERNVKFPCFTVNIDLAGDDRRQMLDRIKGYAEIAAALGAPYLQHTVVPQCADPNEVMPYRDELYRRGIESVREVYDYAKTLGVRTIYENQGYIFNGVERFGKFLDEVDRNVGVVADFANIYQTKNTTEEFVKAFLDRIVHVHIKDVSLTKERYGESLKTLTDYYFNEAHIGEGVVDFEGVIALLNEAGYNGYYGIEYGTRQESSLEVDHILKLLDNWIR